MHLEERSHRDLQPGDHVLVFAEPGFSMLSIYADKLKLPGEAVGRFIDEVNRRNEVGTLLPLAPISAMPRHAIRDSEDAAVVQRFVTEMLGALRDGRVTCGRLVIHLATPTLPRHAREGARAAVEQIQGLAQLGATTEIILVPGL